MKKILLHTFLIFITTSIFAQNSFESLGVLVNSKNSELRPTISADGRTLYFIVSNDENNGLFKSEKKIRKFTGEIFAHRFPGNILNVN